METKVCCRCKEEKDIILFNKKNSSKDNRSSYCKDCSRKIGHDYYINNREIRKKKQYEIYRKYCLNNKEKIKNRQDDWRKKNILKIKESNRKWNLKNKDKVIESNRKSGQKKVINLTDGYIKKCIMRRSNIKYNDIKDSLVKFWRQNLKIKRLLREINT